MTSLKLKLQFSSRLLLVLVGCLCAWLGVTANAARTQRELVKAILAAGGEVFYDWQVTDDGSDSGLEHPPGPDWLRRWLGDEYFQSFDQNAQENSVAAIRLFCVDLGNRAGLRNCSERCQNGRSPEACTRR